MAKDFVTPEQYQRGVGKIKDYVDNLSVIAPLDSTSNDEYVKVNLEDLELTKTYIVPKGRYIGILVTKKDGTKQSVLVVSNTCFSIYVVSGNKGTANRIFYYTTNFGSYKVNVTSNIDNNGQYIIKQEAFVLGADNLIEYNPQTPYSPATKKYVDDTTNTLVKKDTNKYILITNDDTLVIKKDSITDITNATITIDNLTGQFGTLVANDDGTYSYTLNTIMTDVETFTFKVNNVEQKLVIVPYKEMQYDDKNAAITYDSNWTIEENTLYNDGSAHISVKENLATVNFNFKGCGIDIFGKTSSITGRARAELYKGDTRLYRQIIDTNGGTSDQYDVPIFSFSNLDYDSYTIKISSYADNISIFDYIKIYNSLSNIDNSIIELYENKSSSQRSVLYIDRKNFLYTPYHMYDPTTKKYVDDLVKKSKTAMCTDEEVDNMLNEVLGGDYSGN